MRDAGVVRLDDARATTSYSALVWTGGHPGWTFDEPVLDRLVREHPRARRVQDRRGIRELDLADGRVEVEVMDTGESVAVVGELAPVSELVVWFRDVVPDEIVLLLFDAEYTYDAVPLAPGAGPATVAALLENGP